MSSSAVPARRRTRIQLEFDQDEDTDVSNGSGSSQASSSKRARTGEHTPSFSGAQELPISANHGRGNRTARNGDKDQRNGHQEPSATSTESFQPGAIVRVRVTDFVTYTDATFSPGPNLNMIIGPNGTGKSSLVCAICLGLGYSPSLLGRAQKIGEFVKHGRDRATIEIELQARPQDHENHIVKVRITRDGDKRKWWVNNDETSLKAVQALVKELGIQVDNLCQFLPQDRVAEFAALNPVELLHHTQRAAAPEQMLHWHDQLKALRKDQRALQLQQETDQESLTNQEARQENIRADVERLKERTQIQERIQLLKKTVPFVEYTTARNQFMHHKAQRQEAIAKLKDLERTVEPTLRAVNVKQEYQDAIDVVLKERKNQLSEAEKVADEALKEIEAVDAKITSITQARTAEKEGDKKRRQEQLRIHNKVKSLEEQLESPPPAFDPDSWNSRIREREHEVRDINTKQQSIFEKLNELQQEARTKKDAYQEIEVELEQLNSQAGQQVSRLRHASEDTARAWTWIQQNAERFEKEVYGPPMIVLSVKDRRYTDLMEALFQRGDMLTITTQTRSDFKRLSDQLYGQMGLSDINIKCQTRGLMQEMQKRPNISEQQFERFGLDGWASEFLEGPEAVIAMLCNTANLHSTGIALKDVSESQYNMITESRIGSWASGKHYYRINRRAEYGPGATSTLSRDVRRAKFWSDQPVDMSMKTQLEAKRRGLVDQHRELAEEAKPLRDSKDELVQLKKDLEKEIADLKRQKSAQQVEAGIFAALPSRLERERESLETIARQGNKLRETLQEFRIQEDDLIIEKTSLALEHKKAVGRLRGAHEACLEAELRLIEAKSDVEALKQRNQGIVREVEEERRKVQEAQRDEAAAKDIAKKAQHVCQEIMAEEDQNEQTKDYFATVAATLTMEALQRDIAAEQSKLELVHAGNSGAIKEFETREAAIQRLKEKIDDNARRMEDLQRKITEIQSLWEPELDKLVQEISDAFAYNFEQIGCAGEVGVHKDENFDQWAIEIKVKFRENETLQILDQHRQSGGERSVSTIFYLMSLQSLARAPFRVVDEINQGMDARNERMVHERMVEIACWEHNSQYFLITPKLLTGLSYDPRMKVLCIASGEYMPQDTSLLDVRRAINLKTAAAVAAR